MVGMVPRRPAATQALPPSLQLDVERAGYYPALVADVVATALAGEQVEAHLVHQETTFDTDEVRRHVTVLALTATRLVVAHADDHGPDAAVPTTYAAASTEAVPIRHVRSVVLSHVVARPEQYRPGTAAREVTLTIGWGSVQRLDLEPATCGDPECEADHGYTGTSAADDIVVRISAEAEGDDAVQAAVAFARALSTATGPAGFGSP
jgi:Family of unknown function (DUF5998)